VSEVPGTAGRAAAAPRAAPRVRPRATPGATRRAPPRVTVALSGGVDSAVCVMLLARAGYEVRALFMKNWEEDDRDGHCASARDLADAAAVCDRLGVELDTVNFSAEYWDRVFERFLAEQAAGRTSNPDVLCNREIKFDVFLDFALERGADLLATGHYARVAHGPGGPRLLKGVDPAKDQSYFLHTLGRETLARVLFPLGGLTKREVRRLAREAGLAPHDKKDSTGICFIGERRFREFLGRWLPPRPGPIETTSGEVLGTHPGLAYFTLGQRQGLGIGGRPGTSGAPWYVVRKDRGRGALVVAQGRDHPALLSRTLVATEAHWARGRAPHAPQRLRAKTRYRQPDAGCVLVTADAGRIEVRFDEPQWAVTPGQSVVLYDGDECLGGGVIAETA